MVKSGIDFSTSEIVTERLRLVPISYLYENDIFVEFDTNVTKYMFPKPPDRIEETREFITSSLKGLESNTDLQLVIVLRKTNEFIGCTGLHEAQSSEPEVGIWTKTGSHGNRYGSEAFAGLMSWAKENIIYDHFRYPVDRRNRASRRIAEQHGGRIHREFKSLNQSGFELDQVEYRIP